MQTSGLTVVDQEWQEVARRLSADVLAPRAAEIDREGRFPRENFTALADAGLMGLPVGEELGGPGANVFTTTLVTEELARGCASTALCYHMHIAAASLIVALAEGDQVDRYVLPILRGRHLTTYAISEPGSGSRWWHMESHAVKHDDHYYLDSYKSFATSAGEADSYVVPVRATPTSPPHELSIFIVDREVENVKPIGTWDAMGMRGNNSTPIHFAGCRIPERCRLSGPALGFPMLMAYGLPVYQVGLAAVYVGLAQSALDYAMSHVSRRVHADTGMPLSKVETVQRYIAEAALRVDRARVFTRYAARYVDDMTAQLKDPQQAIDDKAYLKALAEVKIIACEAAQETTHIAVQICGGSGYSRAQPLERMYRDARAGSIMGPNDDMLKVLIAQRTLGHPYPWE